MTKLKTLLVDDEPLALKLLKAKLVKLGLVDVIGECKNGREAIAAASELQPDLIFLDIEMPGINGLEVVKRLQNDEMPLIVFTTAYEEYALNAFDLNAVDYILKPIDEERIQRAVERAEQRFAADESRQSKPRILQAIDSMNRARYPAERMPVTPSPNDTDRKIVIKERDEITLLKQADIEWIDAAGDYVCLHAEGQTHIKRSTLKELLEELDDSIFKRVHRSTIVNLNYIEKVIPHTKGEFFLMLGEYERIKVSRNYRDVIKRFLSER